MKSNDGWGKIFDEIKAKENLASDSKLAQSLRVSRTFICAVRKNRKGVSNEMGEELYKRLGRRVIEEDLDLFMSSRNQKIARRVDPRVKEQLLRRANGICELCKDPAPFQTPDGRPYLELHHIVPKVLGGKSSANNIVALCPNCHRKVEICPSTEDIKLMAARAGQKLDGDYLRVIDNLVSASSIRALDVSMF
jgi:hypothetical protein